MLNEKMQEESQTDSWNSIKKQLKLKNLSGKKKKWEGGGRFSHKTKTNLRKEEKSVSLNSKYILNMSAASQKVGIVQSFSWGVQS